MQPTFADGNSFLGRRIWDNVPVASEFYALLPPNSPSCSDNYESGWVSASSNHPGGVSVSLLDGSVRTISEAVETKNLNLAVQENRERSNDTCANILTSDSPPGSPVDPNGRPFSYGVWAELGAVNSRETVTLP